jgi:hypothetical protein
MKTESTSSTFPTFSAIPAGAKICDASDGGSHPWALASTTVVDFDENRRTTKWHVCKKCALALVGRIEDV